MGVVLSHLVCMTSGGGGTTAAGLCAKCGAGGYAVMGTIALQTAIGAVTLYLLYKVGEEAAPHVKKMAWDGYDAWNGICRAEVEDPIICRALLQEIVGQFPNVRQTRVERRQDGQHFIPVDDWYTLKDSLGQYAFDVQVKEKGTKLSIRKHSTSPQQFSEIFNKIYEQRAAGVEEISKYSLSENGWVFSGFLPKRRVRDIDTNGTINEIIEKCKSFGRERRVDSILGIFLEGPPGSGKTMMAKVIASEMNMGMYIVPLSAPYMYDDFLERSIGQVPQKSLIFIDEMGAKMKGLERLEEGAITPGGILPCLDDQHVPSGCIVLATSVSAQEVNELFPDGGLLREGRFGFVREMKKATVP